MKKWVAAALALLVVTNLGVIRADAAKAAETELPEIIDAVVVAPDLEKKPIYDNRGPASASLTTDTVIIDEETGSFTVTTASGTQMSLTAPFGAYCITQDVFQQLDVYLSLYNDVSAALKYYIKNGIHMDIFDFYTGTSTYIAESDDTLAALAGDMNTLNEASVKRIADYMAKNWYKGYPAAIKTVGENQYIAFDLAKDYGFVVYNHFTNGKLIEVYTFCTDGTEGMERLESMIAELTFSTADAVQNGK